MGNTLRLAGQVTPSVIEASRDGRACHMHAAWRMHVSSRNGSHQDPFGSLTACYDLISSTIPILAPPSQGVSSGPIIKAFHVMMLSCLGEPLTPCGGSCCNLLKSLISRCMPGNTHLSDMAGSECDMEGSECDKTKPNLSCRCRHSPVLALCSIRLYSRNPPINSAVQGMPCPRFE